MPEMLASRLVALQKSKGGIRPIAVGEVWLRFCSLCAIVLCDNAGRAIAPKQLVWLGEQSALVTLCVLVPSLTLTMSRMQQT